jgi:hypothetical protein
LSPQVLGPRDGNPIGSPLLDSLVYEVAFPDGSQRNCQEHVWGPMKSKQRVGNSTSWKSLLGTITTNLPCQHRWVLCHTPRGCQHPKRTTQGWQLCAKWRDGSTSWENLKHLKEANPIEAAKYAITHDLSNERGVFSRWVLHILKNKRDQIISAVQAQFCLQ